MKPNPLLRSFARYRVRPAWILALNLFLGACSSGTEPTLTLWEGTLSPLAAGGLTGSVAAVSQFGRTEASIEIRQATANASYGWRVESGTCQAPGQIQGGNAIYPPLDADEAGTAREDAVIGRLFKSGSSFAVRVFRTLPEGGEEVLACGPLEER